jgi:hypothetical protein
MHNQESVRLPAVLPDSGAAAMLVDHRRMDHKADRYLARKGCFNDMLG